MKRLSQRTPIDQLTPEKDNYASIPCRGRRTSSTSTYEGYLEDDYNSDDDDDECSRHHSSPSSEDMQEPDAAMETARRQKKWYSNEILQIVLIFTVFVIFYLVAAFILQITFNFTIPKAFPSIARPIGYDVAIIFLVMIDLLKNFFVYRTRACDRMQCGW